jgi:hypothetical protein
MKNYLIITLGTRDVQLRKSLLEESEGVEVVYHEKNRIDIKKNDIVFEVLKNRGFDDFLAIPPRVSGKIINNNYGLFENFIEFPLFSKVIGEIRGKNTIDYVVLVYTDQQKEFEANQVEQFNYNNDTLFFKDIILKAFKKDPKWSNTEFDEYVVQEKVVDIDFQYAHFGKGIEDLFLTNRDEIGQVFLLPQGGIDQINHAITLQLIQEFKTKVKLYQKAEKNEPRLLEFTNHFLNDLNKQKIIKHLEDYDFGLIDKELTEGFKNGTDILSKCQRAYNELNLNSKETSNEKIITLYLSAKIALHKKDYSSFIWKMFTIIENIFKVECELAIGDTTKYYNSKADKSKMVNTEWHEFLKQCLHSFGKELSLKLYQFLESSQVDGKPLNINNPNRFLFELLYKFLRDNDVVSVTQEKVSMLDKINGILSNLSYHRNKIAHDLYPVSYDKLITWLGSEKTLKKLIRNCDEYFEVKGMGKYDELKKELIQQL